MGTQKADKMCVQADKMCVKQSVAKLATVRTAALLPPANRFGSQFGSTVLSCLKSVHRSKMFLNSRLGLNFGPPF